MPVLSFLAVMLFSFSSGAPTEVSSRNENIAHAPALVRRESHHGERWHHVHSLGHKHVRRQRSRQIGSSSSFIQKSPAFPEYTRNAEYVHPLSKAGQDLENRAVKELTPKLVMDFLKSLIDFPTRSYTNQEESKVVEEFLKKQFNDIGLVACYHTFASATTGGDGQLTNVVAYIPGSSTESVVLGAHYDSRPYAGSAPGAEDNGSGVAALLAIAKAFKDSGITPKASIYFVAFAGEEPGLIGSEAFSEALQKGGNELPEQCHPHPNTSFLLDRRGSSLASNTKVIVMDEVGWSSPDLDKPTVNLETYDWTKPLMDHLAESSQTHNGQSLRIIHSNNPFGSDHMSFLDKHIMAVLTINGNDEDYPNYHQSSDTIDNVDPHLLTMISKMNLGALVRMAGSHGA